MLGCRTQSYTIEFIWDRFTRLTSIDLENELTKKSVIDFVGLSNPVELNPRIEWIWLPKQEKQPAYLAYCNSYVNRNENGKQHYYETKILYKVVIR